MKFRNLDPIPIWHNLYHSALPLQTQELRLHPQGQHSGPQAPSAQRGGGGGSGTVSLLPGEACLLVGFTM